jgi:aminoglycoside phosphotransferase (APT) family kinase protein
MTEGPSVPSSKAFSAAVTIPHSNAYPWSLGRPAAPLSWHDRLVSSPAQPDPALLRRLLAALDPDLALVGAQPLAGGVSAQVTRIDSVLPDGTSQRLVVREYGAANLRSDPRIAAHEFELLSLLRVAGLPVPRPRLADESRSILPLPYLVVDFIDGAPVTEPAQLTTTPLAFTGQLAAVLAGLHGAGLTCTHAPYLPDIRDKTTTLIGTWPSSLGEALNEGVIRARLARTWPPPQVNDPVVLHGDYWPGNTLWQRGALVSVIDWEDAAVGDPLADLANARMEITMAFGTAAASDFTRQYRELMPSVDLTALAHWDLYAGLRHAGRMTAWGLSPASLERLAAGHREFTDAALARLPLPGDRVTMT